MKKINTFIKNGLILTFASLILKIITMIFNVFLSNNISSQALGIFGLILSVFSFLSSLALSGINLASTRLISKESSYGIKNNIPFIVKDCLKYCTFFSILSILVMFIFRSYFINVIFKNAFSPILFCILSIALPLCSFSSCLCGYFISIKKIKCIIISQFIEIIVQIFFTLICYYLGYFNTINQICLVLVTGLVLSTIISFLYLISMYFLALKKYKYKNISKKNYTKQICQISLPVAFTTYIKTGLSTLKNSLIPIALVQYGFSRAEALSGYGLISSTALSLLLFPLTLIQSFSSLLIPELSTYDIKTEARKIIKISKKCIYLSMLFGIIVSFFFILFAKYINTTMYKTLKIEWYIKILAPIVVYIYADNVIDNILKSINLQFFVMLINVIDLIVSILFIKFLIPKYGINGYIFILYFSEIFNFALSLIALKIKFSYMSRHSLATQDQRKTTYYNYFN